MAEILEPAPNNLRRERRRAAGHGNQPSARAARFMVYLEGFFVLLSRFRSML
jgi:hypothetical protein